MKNLTLPNRWEQQGETLWENYLNHLKVRLEQSNQPVFINNFWLKYEHLVIQLKQEITSAPEQPTSEITSPPQVEKEAFSKLFYHYWQKPFVLTHYTQQQVKRWLSKTLVFIILSVISIPVTFIYLSQSLSKLVLVAGIVLVFFPREKLGIGEKKVKDGVYEFNDNHLTYQKQALKIKIPYQAIHNLWYDPQGRIIVGQNAQTLWQDTQATTTHQVIIPPTETQEWQQVREFLSTVATHNLQLNNKL